MGIEKIYLNIVKCTYDEPTAKIILNGKKIQSIPPKIRNKGAHFHHYFSTYFWKY